MTFSNAQRQARYRAKRTTLTAEEVNRQIRAAVLFGEWASTWNVSAACLGGWPLEATIAEFADLLGDTDVALAWFKRLVDEHQGRPMTTSTRSLGG